MLKPEKSFFERHRLIIILCAVLLVVGVIGGPIAFKITEHPKFCTICHNMRESVASYFSSTHEGVECYKCHWEPGVFGFLEGQVGIVKETLKFITGAYEMEKVESEVSDRSCLRKECHGMKRLEGEEFFRKGVIFSHKPHLEELKCTSCHDTHSELHMSLNTKICFDCHSAEEDEPETCRACHTTLKETEELSHLEFIQEGFLCGDCHAGVHSF